MAAIPTSSPTAVLPVKPLVLFNFLQRSSGASTIRVIDARNSSLYDASHIRGAINVDSIEAFDRFVREVEQEASLDESIFVFYDADGSTSSQVLASRLRERRLPVKRIGIITGGFENFTGEYPHLCLSTLEERDLTGYARVRAYMSYPTEVSPKRIYLGSLIHACNKKLLELLDIHRVVSLSSSVDNAAPRRPRTLEETFAAANMSSDDGGIIWCHTGGKLDDAVEAIQGAMEGEGEERRILVCDIHGVSSAPAALAAYFMKKREWTVNTALAFLVAKKPDINIPPRIVSQLRQFERHKWTLESLREDVIAREENRGWARDFECDL